MKIIKTLGTAAIQLFRRQYNYQASALAYLTLLALVPLLSIAVSLIAIFPVFTQLINLSRNYILTNIIPASSSIIITYLDNFTQQATRLPKFSLIFLFITAIMLITTIKHTLGNIWRRSEKKDLTTWIIYWLAIIIMPIFISLISIVTSYIFSLPGVMAVANKFGLATPMIAILTLIINTILFSTLYLVISGNYKDWRDALLGGFVAAILFDIAKYGFAYYLRHFASYELIYGALAAIPIFLVWLYISWLIIIYGAIITQISQVIRH